MIGTRPQIAEDTMRECFDLGIDHVWMHAAFGERSVSVIDLADSHSIAVAFSRFSPPPAEHRALDPTVSDPPTITD
ncbi:MAG: hypothetical protein ACRDWS_05495 [Acidimicrobiia bacterium]